MLRSRFVQCVILVLKQVDSSPNFVSLFNFMKGNSSVLFPTQAKYVFLKRSTLNESIWDFHMLGSKFVKFFISCQLWNDKSIPLQILSFFIVMTNISSVDFKPILFKLWIKGPHQCPYFETSSPLVKICHIPYLSVMSFFKPQVTWK